MRLSAKSFKESSCSNIGLAPIAQLVERLTSNQSRRSSPLGAPIVEQLCRKLINPGVEPTRIIAFATTRFVLYEGAADAPPKFEKPLVRILKLVMKRV